MNNKIDLVYCPDKILTQECQSIEGNLEEWRQIAKRMFEIMYKHQGCGLAAPQVGLPFRFFVLRTSKGKELAFVNPVLINQHKDTVKMIEGCLSIPGIRVEIERPRQIFVSWTDLNGYHKRAQYQGLTCRTFLHELDHVQGKLIIDYLDKDVKEKLFSNYVNPCLGTNAPR